MTKPNDAQPRAAAIASFIDYFQHPDLRRESDLRHRSRILIIGLMFLALLMFCTLIVTIIVPFPSEAKSKAIAIAAAFSATAVFLLYSLRRYGNYLACSMAIIVADFMSILGGIAISDTQMVYSTMQLLVIPPLLGYFFGGVRWGTVTGIAVLVAIVIIAFVQHNGVAFNAFSEGVMLNEAKLFVGLIGLIAVSGMAYVYEYTAVMLKRERDLEQANVNRLAHTDALTGLANRFSFDMELASRIATAAAASPQHTLTLCYLDLNGFKPINDRFGHDVGDEILRIVSERLRESLRNVDYVGRQGGDEFVIILDGIHDQHLLQTLAERVLAAIARPMPTRSGELTISGSLGMACFPDHATSAEALRQAADHAMYSAKQSSAGWCCYAPPPAQQNS